MPIENLQQAAQTIAGLLANLNELGGFRLKYRISGGNAADPDSPQLQVELSGPDTPLLTQHNGEMLRALETIAAQALRLDQREQSLISFDAGNFRALREAELKMAAETAAAKVIESGLPYSFPPMNSRERRLLHIFLREIEGVETASHGEGRDRFLAVFPEGKTNLPVPQQGRSRGFGRR